MVLIHQQHHNGYILYGNTSKSLSCVTNDFEVLPYMETFMFGYRVRAQIPNLNSLIFQTEFFGILRTKFRAVEMNLAKGQKF